MKQLYLTFRNGAVKAIPAYVIARDRALYFSENDETTTYQEEYDFTMENDSEIEDWFFNNMDWKDVEKYAKDVKTGNELDYQTELSQNNISWEVKDEKEGEATQDYTKEIERLQKEIAVRDKALEMKGERFPAELLANARKVLNAIEANKEYDSRKDTLEHIDVVKSFIGMFVDLLTERGMEHDKSKLRSPEKEVFDLVTPKLKELEYGSDEYKETLKEMGDALKHHYKNNRHHPEHFENGVAGMNLIDLIEMVCDWNAARLRHDPPKSFEQSLEINAMRFNLPDMLVSIIKNTEEYIQERMKGNEEWRPKTFR